MRSNEIAVVAVVCVLVCCSDGDNANPDSGADTGVDVSDDTAAPDGKPDAGQDSQPDAAELIPATWVDIPAGTFTMGSPTSEPCREKDNAKETQHEVTLTHGFSIQSTEVTQGQFEALMGYNPSRFLSCGVNCPVEQVSWEEAAAYCNALSEQEGHAQCYTCSGSNLTLSCTENTAYSESKIYSCPGYRLPTEAEWEYAYRAGTETAYYNGTNDATVCIDGCTEKDANANKIGWFPGNSTATYEGCKTVPDCGCLGTHPVGQKQKNDWNLHDMAGNVWEWCHDRFQEDLGSSAVSDPWGPASGSSRVVRGGAWAAVLYTLRAAGRLSPASTRHSSRGFRCVRTN